MSDLIVAPVDLRAARYAVENWHYSRSMPAGKASLFGAWENGRYIGAVVYSRGASPWLGNAYGLTRMQVCELTRVALRDHRAPVTQIIARTLVLLRQIAPGLRLVVSFADPVQGHHGGIYQAGNWLYLGESPETIMYDVGGGRLVHTRTYRGVDAKKARAGRPEAPRIIAPPKHRYAMPLDRAMRRQLAPRALPFPSPAGEVSMGDTGPPSR